MTFEDFYPTVEPLVMRLSGEFGRKGYQYGSEAADFQQEFTIWLIEHEAKVAGWLKGDDAIKLIAKSLRNLGNRLLVQNKAQALGYHPSDQYQYRKTEVEALLPLIFEEGDWPEDVALSLIDLTRAYESLDARDQSVIAAIHDDGWTLKMIAEAHGVHESTISRWHDAALTRLSQATTQPQEYDPSKGRRAVSNSTARAIVQNAYDED